MKFFFHILELEGLEVSGNDQEAPGTVGFPSRGSQLPKPMMVRELPWEQGMMDFKSSSAVKIRIQHKYFPAGETRASHKHLGQVTDPALSPQRHNYNLNSFNGIKSGGFVGMEWIWGISL